MKNCQVGPDTQRMLKLGHPWVLADRYTKRWPAGSAGDLIVLSDERGKQLATALYDPSARVVARVLTWGPLPSLSAWLRQRLEQAQNLRRHALLDGTDVCRLVNGEGDGLPGLTLDRYGDYLMLQSYSRSWSSHLDLLQQEIMALFAPRGLYFKDRPQQTRQLEARGKSGRSNRLLAGLRASSPLKVTESNLHFWVDLNRGLHTGLFPDQRRNRREIMTRAAGARVLNLFAFTGSFSVAAAAAGAERVTSVDAADRYLQVARDNFSLNGLDAARHELVCEDVFAALEGWCRERRSYDLIIADPPSFSTTKKSRFATQGGTARLVTACLPLLSSGGLLVTSSNHQKVSLDDYLKQLRRGALDAGEELVTLLHGGQPEDFPVPLGFPEGRYLKFVISMKR